MRQILEKQSGLTIIEASAEELLLNRNQVVGLRTEKEELYAETIISHHRHISQWPYSPWFRARRLPDVWQNLP